jgi:hypothetical protein
MYVYSNTAIQQYSNTAIQQYSNAAMQLRGCDTGTLLKVSLAITYHISLQYPQWHDNYISHIITVHIYCAVPCHDAITPSYMYVTLPTPEPTYQWRAFIVPVPAAWHNNKGTGTVMVDGSD